MFGLHGTGLPPRHLSSSGLVTKLQVLQMPKELLLQPGVAQLNAHACAAHVPHAVSAAAAPATSPALAEAVLPGRARREHRSPAAEQADKVLVAVRGHDGDAPSVPHPSPFVAASMPAARATAVLESDAPDQLPAQPSAAAAHSATAAVAPFAFKQENDTLDALLPSRQPAVRGPPPEGDLPQPSIAHASEQPLNADPLRLESLELKLSAAAAQRRPRTLRPRRPRTPEIADSAQLGAEQVHTFTVSLSLREGCCLARLSCITHDVSVTRGCMTSIACLPCVPLLLPLRVSVANR